MNRETAIEFDKLENQLVALFLEIEKLAKKDPNHAINLYKLEIINNLIKDLNLLFEKGNIPIEVFSLFDDTDLPTHSDIVFLLTQNLSIMDYFRFQNTDRTASMNYWILDSNYELKTKFSNYG